MNENKRGRFVGYSLGALQIFIGLTAIAGGFGLVSDPSGTKMNIPLDWLRDSPFTNYFVPGLVLLIVNGVGNFFAGIATFLRNRYAGTMAVAFGTFLMLFILIEVEFIGLRTLLQPLYLILGLIELMLGLKLRKLVFTIPALRRQAATKI
ncbi:MAG: hypothetical protein JSV47_10750 [Deltaproteobacteria bacterium]|nr:MAG: hypothetical protein JSV47_10750 [Deltaproteobacteria bacterium]